MPPGVALREKTCRRPSNACACKPRPDAHRKFAERGFVRTERRSGMRKAQPRQRRRKVDGRRSCAFGAARVLVKFVHPRPEADPAAQKPFRAKLLEHGY